MSTPRDGLPFVWVSWLTPLLAGEAQCQYAAWVKSHYRYPKRRDASSYLAKWSADPAALVRRRQAELQAEGWQVEVEGANAFRLKGSTAILAGQPDVVARRHGDVLVSDAKTGTPRTRDWFQVLVYLAAWPKAFGVVDATRGTGEGCYPTHRISIAPDELTADRADAIWTLVRQLATTEPAPTPSPRECGFCDVADCTARIDTPI